MPVYEAAKMCIEAFRQRHDVAMRMEIEQFIAHHHSVRQYQEEEDAWKSQREGVLADRRAWVTAALERHDRNVLLQAEALKWNWSPLFMRLLQKPAPGFLTLPCRHNEEEFQNILTWIRSECRSQDEEVEAPPFVRALKLFSRRENGVEAPMICPRVGITSQFLYDRMQQVKFAMKDLPTVGLLLFPSMDTNSADFKAFTDVTASGAGFEEQVKVGEVWMRKCFWRACKDMLALDKEDDLRVLWLEASKARREKALEDFWRIMLLREGVDLGYALGCLDWTGEWKIVPGDVIAAMTALRDLSMQFCRDQLRPWTGQGNEKRGTTLADLEGLDIGGEFGASQVLCTMEALGRVGELEDDQEQEEKEDEGFMMVSRKIGDGSPKRMDLQPLKESGQTSDIQNVSGYNPNDSSSASVCPYTGEVVALGREE